MSYEAPPVAKLPVRRAELVIRPLGDDGRHVVKAPARGDYFELGDEEHFLLTQLDGKRDARAIRSAFNEQFGEPLSQEDLDEFVKLARAQGFLQIADCRLPIADSRQEDRSIPQSTQSLLYWRKRLFDPDRLFTWLAPRLGFCWTRGFLIFSASCIGLAALLLWANRSELAQSYSYALRWETAVWAWLVLFVVTLLHESAHGLTCKRYGGEVHEIGFLLLFFMPCFYCNVSDAWLFKEKSKRLWVTFTGGYFELFLWALAVFSWRLTLPGTLPNYLAFVVLTACGVATLFNFNPLLKLDGYYLLSDWLEIPNLHERALGCFKGWLCGLLWGAPRTEPEARGRLLLGFGLATWLYSLLFLTLMMVSLWRYASAAWGLAGMAGVGLLGLISTKGLFQGLTAGEVQKMMTVRRRRALGWLLGSGSLLAMLCLVRVEDRASAPFQLRAGSRAELRAPVAGFVQEVCFDEGDSVSPGAIVVRLEVPDLDSRRAQKRAEIAAARSTLRQLEIGPRPDEVVEQRRRVQRMTAWRDLAQQDLVHAQQALDEDLARLDQQVLEHQAELHAAQQSLQRAKLLRDKNTLTEEQYQEAGRRQQVAQAQLAQAQFQKRHREVLGTREAIAGPDAQAELARRDKDLADAQATLNLLEAGSRPEEIEAQRARITLLEEEAGYLDTLQGRLTVASTISGVIITPYLKEKVGQYVREGELICLVEDRTRLEAEIALAEEDVARVRVGQTVQLKIRARPFEVFASQVDRIAPTGAAREVQSHVTIYCPLENHAQELRPEMTGYARIYTSQHAIGEILANRLLRLIRTEFWW
jgi:multidrug efflux pump subunit AcrA (membrane-fusion protein)